VIEQFELSHPTPKALRRKLDFLGLRRALEEMQDLAPPINHFWEQKWPPFDSATMTRILGIEPLVLIAAAHAGVLGAEA